MPTIFSSRGTSKRSYAPLEGHTSLESFSLFFSFLLVFSLPWPSFLFFPKLFTFLFSSPVYVLNGRNYEPLRHLIRTLCVHPGCSTLLHETLLTDHYLRFHYFQHR